MGIILDGYQSWLQYWAPLVVMPLLFVVVFIRFFVSIYKSLNELYEQRIKLYLMRLRWHRCKGMATRKSRSSVERLEIVRQELIRQGVIKPGDDIPMLDQLDQSAGRKVNK